MSEVKSIILNYTGMAPSMIDLPLLISALLLINTPKIMVNLIFVVLKTPEEDSLFGITHQHQILHFNGP